VIYKTKPSAWTSMAIVAVGMIGAALTPITAVCAPAETAVNGKDSADDKQRANWLSVGRNSSEDHYSPLAKVDDQNVAHLGLAWFMDLPNEGPLQATPLAIDGVLYFSGINGRVYSVDAISGHTRWVFDPGLDHKGWVPSYGSNRGVAYWKGKIYVGVVDGRLTALDAHDGKVVWSVQTVDESTAPKSLSGAPRVFDGKVIIGNGGEHGRGYVTAYDTDTGKKLWRFYTVPGNPAQGFENAAMAMAAKTWSGEWWKEGDGDNASASVWDCITYDSELHRVYLGTGNANAAIDGPNRGDNLFAASIIALDANTGAYLWHYQETPRDSFDYDASANIVLASLNFEGKRRQVLMQASKNGFFYVIDRITGRLISAEKFSKATWAERIDLTSGRPVEAAHLREGSPITIWPSAFGAHDWQPMSFNPITSLMYIPTLKLGMHLQCSPHSPTSSSDCRVYKAMQLLPQEADDLTGGLVAWDPIGKRKRWEIHYSDSFWNGGVLSTAGNLVFQGTGRGQLNAYSASTGQKLWSFYAGLGINAAPITYAAGGIQYVSVLVGYGGAVNVVGWGGHLETLKRIDYGWRFNEQPRRLLTFALDRKLALPPGNAPRFIVHAVDDPNAVIDAQAATQGAELYHRCAACHGLDLVNIGAFAPDLRESRLALSLDSFRTVVHDGALSSVGMPKFGDLKDEELRAIYMYIRQRARETAHSLPKG
jgi:quinohemoprotein ethanol dehydrogenase